MQEKIILCAFIFCSFCILVFLSYLSRKSTKIKLRRINIRSKKDMHYLSLAMDHCSNRQFPEAEKIIRMIKSDIFTSFIHGYTAGIKFKSDKNK